MASSGRWGNIGIPEQGPNRVQQVQEAFRSSHVPTFKKCAGKGWARGCRGY